MPYQLYLFGSAPGAEATRPFQFFNLSEEELRSRVIEPWDRGLRITWSGITIDSLRVRTIRIVWTDGEVDQASNFEQIVQAGDDQTNRWIAGPAGRLARAGPSSSSESEARSVLKDARRIMVVHGRNTAARDAMFRFLRSLGLLPIEWEEAVEQTGTGSPHNLDAVRAAMDVAQAVVVILTAEEQAGLLPELAGEDSPEVLLEGQPRQNVMLEAGMAMGIDRSHTILVELGEIRRATDFEGLNTIRISNDPQRRNALRSRLRTAGCDITESGSDWLTDGDFDGSVVAWEPQALPNQAFIVAIPEIPLHSGERAELRLRCYGLPEEASVICKVTSSAGEVAATADGTPAGGDAVLFSVTFPDDFEGGNVVAGHHAVLWSARLVDASARELASAEFRFA